MVNKVIYNSYDANTGETYLVIKNKYGIFDGTSRKSPEDPFSSFAGWDCAEIKAQIQCCRDQKSKAKIKVKTLENCYKALASVKDIDEKSVEMSRFRKQIHVAKREVEEWDATIEALKSKFWDTIEKREETIQKLSQLKKDLVPKKGTTVTDEE